MIRYLVYLVFCVLASASIGWAADTKSELHEYLAKACQSKTFMGAASVTVNGSSIFSEACGLADAEWKVENTVDTRFLTGSIGKQITASAVLLLYQERKVSLADPIGKYLADLPESWRSATIHQLLTNTSGIPIFTSVPAVLPLMKLGATPNQMIDLVRDKPLLYPHGTKFTYNNTGYILLGMLIEKVSGGSYERFVQEQIFDHLGMRESGFGDVRKIIPMMAKGYVLAGGELQNADFIDPKVAWSAGDFYSTTHDLTLWSEALTGGKLLNSDSVQRMFAVYPETLSQGEYYGYGVVLNEHLGHHHQSHGGGINGFNSTLDRYPESGLVIVVMSNLDLGSSPSLMKSWDVADGLAEIWFRSHPK